MQQQYICPFAVSDIMSFPTLIHSKTTSMKYFEEKYNNYMCFHQFWCFISQKEEWCQTTRNSFLSRQTENWSKYQSNLYQIWGLIISRCKVDTYSGVAEGPCMFHVSKQGEQNYGTFWHDTSCSWDRCGHFTNQFLCIKVAL